MQHACDPSLVAAENINQACDFRTLLTCDIYPYVCNPHYTWQLLPELATEAVMTTARDGMQPGRHTCQVLRLAGRATPSAASTLQKYSKSANSC